MQLHQIQPKHRQQRKHRIGRGGKKGTYSGKGIKGQSARAGARLVPIIRSLIKRYPKIRGYRVQRVFPAFQAVSLHAVEKAFKANEVVSPASLLEKGVVSRFGGKTPAVKILAAGDMTKALAFEGCTVSQNAKTLIEKAGGTVKA
ncbi:MAG: 50S ribosomal protein L15 [Candidatus Wildermuthbacteria bacterium RIFCSPHIGHO2_02_FULL_47_12]|uniref:Large ribosomal subunit protein uL15 n=1 Tax=Candidatus Wildermuthbacteria bacterium RIFCSPHIGHO2_02_FULL_47_12 TaxID=1802451 RepID=A0A1G2R2L4_9BACT|nr:MAG: 50S ribosomal protein L15 [Candidatus Wildermuthbacteria bacterium RIFCSPHIGHO2_02_FULL_47_12]